MPDSSVGQTDRSASEHYLTPTELARELGKQRREVISLCVELGVPVIGGRISRERLVAALQAKLEGK